MYDSIIKAKSIDQVFGKSDGVIVFYPNFQSGNTTSGHYVALIRNKKNNHIYFYDSYGFLPDQAKKFAKDRGSLYSDYGGNNKLIELLLKSKYNIDYSPFHHQEMSDEIATCGRHALMRNLWKHLTNDQYNQAILHWSRKLDKTPDEFVTTMFN